MSVRKVVVARVAMRIVSSKGQLTGTRRSAEQWLSDAPREHVVEIEMQLSNDPNAGAALAVDRDHRLQPDLEITSDPDDAGVDGASGRIGVAEIVGDGRGQAGFHDRDQVIDEIGQSEIDNLGFQVGHAVLQRGAVDQLLRNEDVLGEVERAGRNLVADLSGEGEGADAAKAVRQIAKTFPEINRRGHQTEVGGEARTG